jgi:tetratricopeptide (TPR) repeat protein
VYDSALREHQGKRYNAAIKMFTDALAYEEKITGGRSKLAYEVRDKLADVYYLRGITEFSQQEYAEAYRDFKTALQQSANHAQASRMLGQLEVRASEVYKQAYAMAEQNPDKAKDLYKTVLKMVPTSHEVYRKAKERLDALK